MTTLARDYPAYFPNQAGAGLPYVYFANSSYSARPAANVPSGIGPPNYSPDLYYTATSLNGSASAAAPYFNSSNCNMLNAPPLSPQYSWAQLHWNPDTFQLLAAGADDTYGGLACAFPADITVSLTPFLYLGFSIGPFPSVQNKNASNPGPEDNITNFATGRLKEAAERLSQ